MPTPIRPTGETATAVAADTLISVPEVAHRLGVNVRHIRRLVAERKIPYFKWGHLIRFDPTEIDNWLRQSHRPAVG